MPDEIAPVIAPPTTEEPAASTPVETPTTDAAPVQPAVTPSWQEVIDKVDPKELRKHSRIAGMMGSERQNAVQEYDRRQTQDKQAKQHEETEGEMLKLFEDNADYVKESYPRAWERYTQMQQDRATKELQGRTAKEQREIAEAVGAAHAETWVKLNEEQQATVAQEIQKAVTPKQQIDVFNRLMNNFASEQKTAERLAEVDKKAREEGRKAGRQEAAAESLNSSDAPDMARPKGAPSGVNIAAMTDAEHDAYWNSRQK